MAIDGISRFISVTLLKASNANDEAMSGADSGRVALSKELGADNARVANTS